MSHALKPGVWGVVATPFLGSALEIDETSLERLVAHYERAGAVGLTVLGVFGEAAHLSIEERRDVVEIVVDAVDLPLVVGATSLGTIATIEQVQAAKEAAGDRLVAAMVQVNTGHAQRLADHLSAVYAATGVPVVVQDYPAASGVTISSEALVTALRDLDFIAAVKAESAPTPQKVAALTAGLQVPVFGGLGGMWLLDELVAGAAGAMTGFSFPEALVACIDAFATGGDPAATETFMPFLPVVNFEQQAGVALAIRKEMLRQRGLILESGVRLPGAPLPEELADRLRTYVDRGTALLGGVG